MTWRKAWVYEGANTSEISFPLGGIGSGCVGLAGNGRLIDWEIFNRPNKGGLNGFSHFAIKAERDGKLLDARVVQGDFRGPLSGQGSSGLTSFGFGPDRTTMAGLPHFRKVKFEGRYPIAHLTFEEPAFPGVVRLTAFNPFIPLNDADSSIPAAFFEFEVANTTAQTTDYTLAFTVKNPCPEKSVHRLVRSDRLTLIQLASDHVPAADVKFGDVTIGTDAAEVCAQEYWYRGGGWFDNLGVWWRDFTAAGPLRERTYPAGTGGGRIMPRWPSAWLCRPARPGGCASSSRGTIRTRRTTGIRRRRLTAGRVASARRHLEELLCHALSGFPRQRAVRTGRVGAPVGRDVEVPRRAVRFHAARRSARCGIGQHLDSEDAHGFEARGRLLLRFRGLLAGQRLLRGILPACVELRLRPAVPVSEAGAVDARAGVPLQHGRRRRPGLPVAVAGR